MTKVKSYRINVDEYAREGDAIVIGTCGGMTSQHLGTSASFDAGCCAGNVPVVNSCGVLPDAIIPSGAMKKSVYDKCGINDDAFNYNNFYNKPEIPVVNDPVVTFTQGGVTVGSISLNQAGSTEIGLMAGGVTAGNGIDILNNEVSVDYDNTSIGLNTCNKLEVKDYSTIVSGAAAGATAVQANDLATVAMTGNYCDLINKPEIPSAQIQSDWGQTNTALPDYIKNKPTIGNATITLQKNGTDVDTFTLNQTANKCLNLTLNKCDVGLNNVDNTSDADKPVSDATQCALNCKQDNITDLNTIRTNSSCGKCAYDTIGNYGDIVSHNVCEFATATQGLKADSAVQPGDLATVATSGKYCDLIGTPTIPTDNCQLANSCGYTTCTGTLVSSDLTPYAKTCSLCAVATSGKYCDLTGQPTIPTDNCQLANSCNYITNAVNNLTNYYLKCETYQKCEVDNLISNFGGFEVVSTLPTTGIKTNVIYLLGPIGTGADKYEEWIYYNNTWTKIGETTTDLSNYAKCCDIPTDNCQLSNSCGYTTCTGTLVASDLQPYTKTCTLCTVATSGKYCDLTGTPTIPTDNCQLANSCGYTTCTGTLVASDLTPYAKCCDLKTVATSGKYCDLTGTPSLATVATSGCYNDLNGTPTLCTVATSGQYYDLSGTPSLATVATSGCYNDLTGKPTIPTDNCQLGNSCNYITKDVTNLTCYTPTSSLATVATSGAYCDLTGTPTLACVACSGSYEDLCCKPNLGVYQTTANMVCDLIGADDSHYPTAKTVADALSSCGAGDMLKATYDPCNKNTNAFDYNNFINTPSLCTVATSGKYCDLTGTPTIPAALSAGNAICISSNCINVVCDNCTIKKNGSNKLYADFSGLATVASLCRVATSGQYCDLTGRPTIPDVNTITIVMADEYDNKAINEAIKEMQGGKTVFIQLNNSIYQVIEYDNNDAAIFASSPYNSQCCCYSNIAYNGITIYLRDGEVRNFNVGTINLGKFLDVDTNYGEAYMPTCNGHPATKKYVDDCLCCKANISSLCTVATSGAYCDLSGKPSLCTVATSGCYCDLTGTPTIPTVNTKTFTLSSTSDTTNATDALTYINGGGNAIVILNNIVYTLTSKSSSSLVFKSTPISTANTSDTTINVPTLTFTISNSAVTEISSSNSSLGQYLQTDRNYGTAYTPCYNGSPATKKYVDDSLKNKQTVFEAGTDISISNPIVPEGYTQLTYLGANGQINLGFRTTNNSRIEASWTKNKNAAKFLYQADSGSSLTTNTTAYSTTGNANWRFGNRYVSIETSALKDYLTVQDSSGVTVNGTTYAYSTVNTFSSTNYFRVLYTGDADIIRIKYLKHYSSNVLTLHIVPAMRNSDGAYGFYDVVSDTFFTDDTLTYDVGEVVHPVISFNNESGYALDSGLVHNTGDETIAGAKTFTSPVDIQVNADAGLNIKSNSAGGYLYVTRGSGNNAIQSEIKSVSSGGAFGTASCHSLMLRTNDDTKVTVGTDGSVVLATDVVTNSDNNQVATTKWTNCKLSCKQDTLTAGYGICIDNGTICATGGGDMSYSDFNWSTKSGATVTLDLNSTITPSANFTVNKPSTIKEGQAYVLRVTNGATAYTMTLGSGITNPFGEDLTLTANGTDQFIFLATSSSALELQGSGGSGENVFVTEQEYAALLPGAASDGKTYFIYE